MKNLNKIKPAFNLFKEKRFIRLDKPANNTTEVTNRVPGKPGDSMQTLESQTPFERKFAADNVLKNYEPGVPITDQKDWNRLRRIASMAGKDIPEFKFAKTAGEIIQAFKREKLLPTRNDRLKRVMTAQQDRLKSIVDGQTAKNINFLKSVAGKNYQKIAANLVEHHKKSIAEATKIASEAFQRHQKMRSEIAQDPEANTAFHKSITKYRSDTPAAKWHFGEEYAIMKKFHDMVTGKIPRNLPKFEDLAADNDSSSKTDTVGTKDQNNDVPTNDQVRQQPPKTPISHRDVPQSQLDNTSQPELSRLINIWVDNYENSPVAHKNLLKAKNAYCKILDGKGINYDKDYVDSAFKLGSVSDVKYVMAVYLPLRYSGYQYSPSKQMSTLGEKITSPLKPQQLQAMNITQLQHLSATLIKSIAKRKAHSSALQNIAAIAKTIYSKVPETQRKNFTDVNKVDGFGTQISKTLELAGSGIMSPAAKEISAYDLAGIQSILSS